MGRQDRRQLTVAPPPGLTSSNPNSEMGDYDDYSSSTRCDDVIANNNHTLIFRGTPRNWPVFMVKEDYDGIEHIDEEKQEEGYLVVYKGDRVQILPDPPVDGAAYN